MDNTSVKEEGQKKKRRMGIIPQVVILFLIGTILIGFVTFISQNIHSSENTTSEMENLAGRISEEISSSVNEYPAHQWLMKYWYENSKTLDIEYDVEYQKGTKTEKKARQLEKAHPDLQLKYANESEIRRLPRKDQKKYAEVVYSWVITRLNQIKRSYELDFLFVVLTDDECKKQFFILSAADLGAVRGTEYGQVYPLGKISDVNESQTEAMKSATKYSRHLAEAGEYVDYYHYMGKVDDKTSLIGLTYSVKGMLARIKENAVAGTVISMVYLGILALVCLILIYLFVLKPLKKIQSSIKEYKASKDSKKVREDLRNVHPHNEIGELSEDVTELADAMDDYHNRIEKITAEKERIETELSLAEKIQGSMLPSIFPPYPDRKEFEIHAVMDPAREVGGDFYDFFLIDDDHLCVVIADVSGKGIPAALFMMASKIIIKSFAMLGLPPEEILTRTNDSLCADNKADMFVTVWLGILDLSTGKMVAVNAGHEYPAIKKKGGDYELLKDKHGFVIGGMEGARYKQYDISFEPGSRLFLYTDGVPEATDADNGMFGTDRMIAALNTDKDGAPEHVIETVRKAVDGFVKDAEQFDDMTMLSIKYNGKKK